MSALAEVPLPKKPRTLTPVPADKARKDAEGAKPVKYMGDPRGANAPQPHPGSSRQTAEIAWRTSHLLDRP